LRKEQGSQYSDDSGEPPINPIVEYQNKVKRRLREKRSHEENVRNARVKYIAQMMPTAMDMHRFMKIMKKDEIFENPRAYKIVSKVDSYPDRERVAYLMEHKLSTH